MRMFCGLFLGVVCGCAAIQGYHGSTAVTAEGAFAENVPVPPRQLPDVLARLTEDRAAQAAANDQRLRSRAYWDAGDRSVGLHQMQMCEADHTALRAYCMEHLADDDRCVLVLQMGPTCMNQVGAGSRGFGFGYGGFGYAGAVVQIGSPYMRSYWHGSPPRAEIRRREDDDDDRYDNQPPYEEVPAGSEGGAR